MNKTLSTILIVFAGLALAGLFFFFGAMYVRGAHLPWLQAPGSAGVYSGSGFGMGPGMMGAGVGGQRGYGMGPGMMGGYGWNNRTNSNLTPLTVDQAKQAAEKYIQTLNIQRLAISEVMVFDNNAYVAVKESDTGLGAFELLVDPVTQVAYPEYGPNMMWNLKYGGMNHSRMMGGNGGMGNWNNQSTNPANVSADMPVTKDQAIKNAQAYLDQYQPGTTAANDPTQFYGYYTLDFSKDGTVAGMLSVNGYSGQIFLHTWHGTFVEESK
jgi:hypothetical protein